MLFSEEVFAATCRVGVVDRLALERDSRPQPAGRDLGWLLLIAAAWVHPTPGLGAEFRCVGALALLKRFHLPRLAGGAVVARELELRAVNVGLEVALELVDSHALAALLAKLRLVVRLAAEPHDILARAFT